MSQSIEEEEVFYETVCFDMTGDFWIINMPGNIQFSIPYNEYIGLKYIIIILLNHKYCAEKEIHIERLRKIVIEYAKDFNKIRNKSDHMDAEDIRRILAMHYSNSNGSIRI